MLKLLKEKVLVSLVVVLLVALVIGNVASLATEPTVTINAGATNTNKAATPGVQITATGSTNTNKANTNSNTESISATVGATNNTAKNTNKASTNTNKANTTAKLPYAGAESSVAIVVIALAASAIYEYKKVSDYNI